MTDANIRIMRYNNLAFLRHIGQGNPSHVIVDLQAAYTRTLAQQQILSSIVTAPGRVASWICAVHPEAYEVLTGDYPEGDWYYKVHIVEGAERPWEVEIFRKRGSTFAQALKMPVTQFTAQELADLEQRV